MMPPAIAAILIAVTLLASWTAPAGAQTTEAPTEVRTFRCLYTVMATATMRDDKPVALVADERFEMTFDHIDLDAGTARMVAEHRTANVSVKAARVGLTFFEPLSTGFFQVTAIYAPMGGDTAYKSVHSRHTSSSGLPLPSQYYGACVSVR